MSERVTFGTVEYVDHQGTYGEVLRDGVIYRSGEYATTCVRCAAVLSRGRIATGAEVIAHRGTCRGRAA